MKNTFDLSALDGVLNNAELENKIKEEIKAQIKLAPDREKFFCIPISGNEFDEFAFEFLECYIALHLKKVYLRKTWKLIEHKYEVEAYRIQHAKRKSIYDNFDNVIYKKAFVPCLSDVETVDESGKPV